MSAKTSLSRKRLGWLGALIGCSLLMAGCSSETPNDPKTNEQLKKGMQGTRPPDASKIPPEARAMMGGQSKPK